MRSSRPGSDGSSVPVLHVHTPDGRVFRFEGPFSIGREHDCDLRLDDVHVSRRHLEGRIENGAWCLRDLKSANGLFVKGKRVQTATVKEPVVMSLGVDGPELTFELEGTRRTTGSGRAAQPTVQSAGSETRLLQSYEQKYFGTGPVQGGGGHTRIIRMAFQRAQRKQQRRYQVVIVAAALLAVGAGAFAYYKHQQMAQQQELAQAIFYSMKALDVNIASVEKMIAESGSAEAREQVKRYRADRQAMESNYDRLSAVRKLYDSNLDEEDRLILRVTRLFGECELAAPDEYLTLVKSYIRKWQSSGRYVRAVQQAKEMGFSKFISEEFTEQSLPPQFFYLAMQESSFDQFASGPPTYAGIAKGMWQFIPETGARYGLTIGPLAKLRRPDPDDDRHNWRKATVAASKYIKDIYATDAQASGLLVMASYNWGENRVIRMIRSLPAHPQDRNFWKLIEQYRNRIPKETYDYVFYIVSAAVIGENPRMFGFDLDNPLATE